MDDPWGSPWAEETQYHQIEPKNEQKIRNTVETAAVPITLPSHAVVSSPWGNEEGEDDDDFGEWSSEPLRVEKSLPIEGFGAAWSGQDEEERDIASKKTATEWEQHDRSRSGADLKFSPTQSDESSNQASFDPWSTEAVLDSEDATNKLDPAVGFAPKDDRGRGLEELFEDNRTESLPSHVATNDARDDDLAGNKHMEDVKDPDVGKLGPVDSTYIQHSPRTSVSPSDSSRHDTNDQQETPRTSLDDELVRPSVPRKISSKIQPLIEHFDGLEHEAENGISRTYQVTSIEVKSEAKDQNREKAPAEDSQPSSNDLSEGKDTLLKEAPASQSSRADAFIPSSQDKALESTNQSQSSNLHGEPQPALKLDVDIKIDLAELDELFPETVDASQVPDIFVPDVVPYESFTSMEQRKTWYRISRYGSMRKHDSGNDEGHARLTWQNSSIHDETIKVVARWMEEDRLSGQVMLGGTGRTSTLFGWGDAKSPPVSLEAVFAARQNKRKSGVSEVHSEDLAVDHATNTASEAIPNTPRRSENQTSTDEEERRMPSFGWSSNAELASSSSSTQNVLPSMKAKLSSQPSPTPTTKNSALVPANHTISLAAVQALDKTSQSKNQFDHSASESNPSIWASTNSGLPTDNDEEEEDDWGEMVSTPVVEPQSYSHAGPLSEEPQLAKQTFSGDIITPAVNLQQSSENHSATNFDEFLDSREVDHYSMSQQSSKFVNGSLHTSVQPVPNPNPPASKRQSFTSAPMDSAIKLARPSPLKQVTFSANSMTKVSTHHDERSTVSGASEQRIVQNIINNLPNLSYMLKR